MKHLFISLSLAIVFQHSSFAQRAGEQVVVIAEQAPLKSGADVRAQLDRGTVLLVRDVNDVWLKVRFHGITGWVYAPQVIPADDAIDYFSRRISSRPRPDDFVLR